MRRNRDYLFPLVAVTAVLSLSVCSQAATTKPNVLITEAGKPRVSIVVPKECSPTIQFAAKELQRTIQQMSGATCPIVADHVPGRTSVISVGSPMENSLTARLLNQAAVDFDALKLGDDGFTLRTVGSNIVAAGVTGRATLYAAYALLERLGCRWCFPGKYGEVIPKQPTLKLSALKRVEKPAFFSYRTFMHVAAVSKETVDWIDWMAKNRMNRFLVTLYPAKGYKGQLYSEFKNTPGLLEAIRKRDLLIEAGHHSLYYWIPPREFYEKKPEFFAEVNGRRGPVAIKGPRAQFCFSNEELAAVTAERIIAFAHANPEADVLSLYTNDGRGYCECDACKAIGSKTDVYILYVNRVAKRVHRVLPDKRLSFLSYNEVCDPPRLDVFDKNTLCVIATWMPPDVERLKSWLASGAKEVALYEYYMGSYSDRSIPWVAVHEIADELKTIHELGLVGVASQCELRNWGSYALNYWVFAKMIWNPDLSVDEVLSDYYRHYYEEAARPMKAYFEFLESMKRMPRDLNVPAEKIHKLDELLGVGEKAAATEATQVRIRRDRLCLDYLKLAWSMENARRQAKMLCAKGQFKDAVKELSLGVEAGKACLEHLHQYADQRAFLMGRSDRPKEIVGHFYTTRYYENLLAKLEAELTHFLTITNP